MKKQRILICIFSAILLFAVVVLTLLQTKQEDVKLFSIEITTQENTEKIDCWKNEEGECYLFLPSYAQLSQTRISLNGTTEFFLDETPLVDGMSCEGFLVDTPYTLTYTAWGKKYQRKFTLLHSADMPTIHIQTQSGNMEYIHKDKGNKEPGLISVYAADGILQYEGAFEGLNGRGNYTWENYDKKPYSLHMTESVDFLGLGAAQEWILLANAADSSHIRNKIVYDFADSVGLSYSPDSTWVDLYLNGEYVGLYLLSERNEVHSERVAIEESGSFLVSLELKERLDVQQHPYVSTVSGQALRVHYPLNITTASVNFIERSLQSVENAILAEDGIDPITGKNWQELIDLDSWVRKYLIEEIFGNIDACIVSQYFYYKGNTDGKVYAGPVWDFDNSMGSEETWELSNPKTFRANQLHSNESFNTKWIFYLYQKEEFHERIVELYEDEFLPLLNKLIKDEFNTYTTKIFSADNLNRVRWNFSENVFTDSKKISAYMAERVDFLKNAWINNTQYYYVKVESYHGGRYAILPGETIDLPQMKNEENAVFLGWYYAGTDEPFNINTPITEDITIYAKWSSQESFFDSMLFKLAPVGVIAILFLALFAVEFIRIKGGWKKR